MTQNRIMKTIKLTKGYEAVVDDADFDYLSQFKWCSSHGYAVARIIGGNGEQMRMHRLILNARENEFVDHIDMNPLNNVRNNLRISDKAQNMRNRGKQTNNTSGFKGIGWDVERNKWKVQLKAGEIFKMKRLKDLNEAQKLYSDWSTEYHGAFARTK